MFGVDCGKSTISSNKNEVVPLYSQIPTQPPLAEFFTFRLIASMRKPLLDAAVNAVRPVIPVILARDVMAATLVKEAAPIKGDAGKIGTVLALI